MTFKAAMKYVALVFMILAIVPALATLVPGVSINWPKGEWAMLALVATIWSHVA